jgi:putative flippase GtrA
MKKTASKFLLIGAAAFAIDYGLTLLLHYVFGVTGYIASAISFTVGFVFSFSLSRQWVFRPKSSYKYSIKRQTITYLMLAAVNLVISSLMIAGFALVDVDVYVSKVIAIALVACWNFVISHYLIFSEK